MLSKGLQSRPLLAQGICPAKTTGHVHLGFSSQTLTSCRLGKGTVVGTGVSSVPSDLQTLGGERQAPGAWLGLSRGHVSCGEAAYDRACERRPCTGSVALCPRTLQGHGQGQAPRASLYAVRTEHRAAPWLSLGACEAGSVLPHVCPLSASAGQRSPLVTYRLARSLSGVGVALSPKQRPFLLEKRDSQRGNGQRAALDP